MKHYFILYIITICLITRKQFSSENIHTSNFLNLKYLTVMYVPNFDVIVFSFTLKSFIYIVVYIINCFLFHFLRSIACYSFLFNE